MERSGGCKERGHFLAAVFEAISKGVRALFVVSVSVGDRNAGSRRETLVAQSNFSQPSQSRLMRFLSGLPVSQLQYIMADRPTSRGRFLHAEPPMLDLNQPDPRIRKPWKD